MFSMNSPRPLNHSFTIKGRTAYVAKLRLQFKNIGQIKINYTSVYNCIQISKGIWTLC